MGCIKSTCRGMKIRFSDSSLWFETWSSKNMMGVSGNLSTFHNGSILAVRSAMKLVCELIR